MKTLKLKLDQRQDHFKSCKTISLHCKTRGKVENGQKLRFSFSMLNACLLRYVGQNVEKHLFQICVLSESRGQKLAKPSHLPRQICLIKQIFKAKTSISFYSIWTVPNRHRPSCRLHQELGTPLEVTARCLIRLLESPANDTCHRCIFKVMHSTVQGSVSQSQ